MDEMRKIYEFPLYYNLIKRYMLFCFKRFYGEFIVVGRENLPLDNQSGLIFAPNHLNALMDALAVSSLVPHRKAVIYLARADFFAHKTVAKLMHAAKIMPAFRMRDGMDKLEKNNRIFYECINVLRFNHALCIMPEGGQGEQQKIRPLVKGIFRIAFDAQQQFGDTKRIKIVPVGINLGSLEKCGKHIIINIGKPIEVQDYMESFKVNPAATTNEIKDELHRRMSSLTLDLATEKYYDSFETIVEIMENEYVAVNKKENVTFEKFKLKQQIAHELIDIEENEPEKMEELTRLTGIYKNLMARLNFKSSIFGLVQNAKASWKSYLYLLLTFPLFVFGFITNALPFFTPVWIRKMLPVGYSGFYSSVQFGLGLITFPLFYIVQALLFHLLISPNWWISLIFLLLQYLTRSFTLKWYSGLIKIIHKNRFNNLLISRTKKSNLLYRLITVRNRIVHRINTKRDTPSPF